MEDLTMKTEANFKVGEYRCKYEFDKDHCWVHQDYGHLSITIDEILEIANAFKSLREDFNS